MKPLVNGRLVYGTGSKVVLSQLREELGRFGWGLCMADWWFTSQTPCGTVARH